MAYVGGCATGFFHFETLGKAGLHIERKDFRHSDGLLLLQVVCFGSGFCSGLQGPAAIMARPESLK